MRQVIAITVLLVLVALLTTIMSPRFVSADNIENLLQRTALFGILGIGAAFVIITGGIDLSSGSVVGLTGTLLPFLLVEKEWGVGTTLLLVAVISVAIGLFHGLLVTKLKLQPFIVTLCGLLFYRGLARYITGDATQGFGDKFEGLRSLAVGRPFEVPVPLLTWISQGNFSPWEWNARRGQYVLEDGQRVALDLVAWIPIPAPFLILIGLGLLAAGFLNLTIYGRYLLALGRNEQAARLSGIRTDGMIILAYVISSTLAGLGGVLFALDLNSVQPAGFGSFYELFAIAAAVLGGCSLRGGEGSVLGVVIGALLIRVLYNAINLLRISTTLEYTIIGAVILAGAIADEVLYRYTLRRKAKRLAQQDEAPPSGD